MFRRLGGHHRTVALGDQTDQTLAPLHPRLVDGGPVQTFGRIEFKLVVGTAQVNRAHIRHHMAGDHLGQEIESCATASRMRFSRTVMP